MRGDTVHCLLTEAFSFVLFPHLAVGYLGNEEQL